MSTARNRLVAYLDGRPIGELAKGRGGALSFRYIPEYSAREDGIPLSLSMPVSEELYGTERVRAFLWGLLPDSDFIINEWAKRFKVSPMDAFGLLEATGEDCAGAVRFFGPGREDRVTQGGLDKVSESEIAQRLRDLVRDPSRTRELADHGKFSLAGAQAKTALHRRGDEWFLPWGAVPTTHILKPARPDLLGHVENEHYCLRLAEAVGLPAAKSEVMHFGEMTAIVIERYDRVLMNDRMIRVHQEDACQALSIHPSFKYEPDGGPGIRQIMELLDHSTGPAIDRERFMAAICFNYMILGTDAHAKNYSLLLGSNSQVRLARFYDLASLLPYPHQRKEAQMAMKIGGYYRDNQIRPRHFERMARECHFPPSRLLEIFESQSRRALDAAPALAADLEANGITHPTVRKLSKQLVSRIQKLRELFNFS